MSDQLLFVLGLGSAHLLLAMAQASVLAWYYGIFGFPNLKSWAWSMVALGLGVCGSSLSFYLAVAGYEASSPVRLTSTWLAQAGTLASLGLLAAGTLELLHNRSAQRWPVWPIAALAGLLLTLPFAFQADSVTERLVLRVGVRYSLSCLGLLALAWLLRRQRNDAYRPLQHAFFVAALIQGVIVALFFAQLARYADLGGRMYTVLELLSMISIGAGMVLYLLEAEHTRGVRASADLHQLSHYDPATGLANQELLLELTRAALSDESGAALLVIDLDNFREIGDSLGRLQSSEVFREVAHRIKQVTPSRATVARLKHDSYAVLVTAADASSLKYIAEGIHSHLAPVMTIGARQLFLSATIGIAISPSDAGDPDGLLRAALLAVNEGKQKGRAQSRFYAPQLNELADQRLGLTAELREAVINKQFMLFYQPIFYANGRLLGFEALLRWQHPERGLLLPDAFMGMLLHAGIGAQVDRFVLAEALQQIKTWRLRTGLDLVVAVNLSATSFEQADFPDVLERMLNEMGVSATAIELEITESMALENLEQGLQVLTRLKGLGVRVSLDDFGTGYSSLSHLRMLPIQRIKIDRSFVRDVPFDRKDGAIVTALTALAHSLDLTVIAEGVESPEQRAFLDAQGVDFFQGYLLGRPQPVSDIDALLMKGARALKIVVNP